MIIAVDAEGGDHAPYEIVKGSIKAAQEYGADIILVGKKNILHVLISRHLGKQGINVIDASQVIECHESPIKAIQIKPDSSIVVGINLLKNGIASAFVSAGSTGAVIAAALLNLGKIESVPRPAIGSFINIAHSKPTLLIDAGANADCRPEHLVWFAYLGNIYISRLFGVSSPRVSLLSNGGEESKGNKLTRETNELLRHTNLNFIGNIEGHEILKKDVDIVVTDGFTGNIVLKTLEGMSDTWLTSLNQIGAISAKACRLPLRALNRDIGMGSWTKRLDYREYGGACLLGVKGNVIIAHGRSKSKAIKNAIGLAMRTAEHGDFHVIKEESNV